MSDPTTGPRVVGLDLSLTSTGVAVVVGGGFPLTCTLGSPSKPAPTLDDRYRRLDGLAEEILFATRASGPPDLIVIEAPAFSRLNGHQHDRSGLWWLVVNRLRTLRYPVLEVPPNVRAKYATGKGNAGKQEVVIAVTRRYPGVDFSTDDEADALVLCAIGRRMLGRPIEDDLPQTHLTALRTLHLPQESL